MIGESSGNSFSITAPVRTFERIFGTRLRAASGGAIESVDASGRASLELPGSKLPKDLSPLIESVTFGRPPDFGPTSW